MAAARALTIYDYLEAYYGAESPRRRLLPPRTEAQLPTRGTCREQFPTDEMVDQTLYRHEKVPLNYMYFRRLFVQQLLPRPEWMVMNDPLPLEKRLIIYAIKSGTPVLGTANILINPKLSHEITFLMRCVPGAGVEATIQLFLFETYDTSKVHFGGSLEWKKAIGLYFMTVYYDFDFNPHPSLNLRESAAVSVVPKAIDIQKGEGELGFCLMWSLIFLSYLRDRDDLRTATEVEFLQIYRDIIAQKSKRDGMVDLMSRVYGAGRRKTQKNRVRSSHNVRGKTIRKSISGIRRRIRSGPKHRRRRV